METDERFSNPTSVQQNAEKEFTHHVSVPAGEGLRVDKTITIQRPVSDVYSFWSRLQNLPRFMRHLESVTVLDELHSHWVIKTVGEKTFEWDAEIIEQRENEMISWRSTPSADIDNAGSVWFSPTANGQGTELRVALKYSPPGGTTGAYVAKLFNRDAETEIEEDLFRLRSLLETGRLPRESVKGNWQQRAAEATRNAAERTDAYIRENPWGFVLSVAMIGLVAGFLLGRRSGGQGE